jgi:hypothetical protein
MAVVGAIVGGLGAAALGTSAVVAIGVGIASAYAVDYAMDSMMEDAAVDTMGGRNVNTKETTKSREIVYGEIRKGGNILWQDVAGSNNKYLYQITALAHDMCEGIEKVYLDRDLVWYNGTYQGDWWQSGGGVKLDVQVRDGGRAQSEISTGSANTDTHVDYWVNNGTYKHRLQRIAYVWTRFEFDNEKYPNGVPTVTALIKGRKVYDPRISQHDVDDEDSWSYSSNPVLCLFDYLRHESYGAGISADQFDEAQIISAANFCDASVGSPSRTRYRCDGIVDTKQSIRANIKNLLSCMNGRITYAGGKLRIEPYRYATPHSTPLNEDIITGNFTFLAKTPRQDNYNVVKGTFISKEIDYIKTEYPQQESTNNDYVTADGGEHVLNLDLPFTTDTIRAQRLAKLVLLRSRMQARIKARLSAKALDYRVGDNVSITNAKFGIVDNIYEITNCTIGFDSENGVYVDIEARENSADIYDHTASTDVEFVAGEVVELPTAPKSAPVLASTITYDTQVEFTNFNEQRTAVTVNWTAPVGVNVKNYLLGVTTAGTYIDYPDWVSTTTTSATFYLNSNSPTYNIIIKTVNMAGLHETTELLNQPTYSVSTAARTDHFLIVDDVNSVPSAEEWFALIGRNPVFGDKLTLVQNDADGFVEDVKIYLFEPELPVEVKRIRFTEPAGFGLPVYRLPIYYPYESGQPSGTSNAVTEVWISTNSYGSYAGYVYSFTPTNESLTSNIGATMNDVTVTNNYPRYKILNGQPYHLTVLIVPPSFYNTATITDDSGYKWVQYNADIVVTYYQSGTGTGYQYKTIPISAKAIIHPYDQGV